jgi:hypothetical protein
VDPVPDSLIFFFKFHNNGKYFVHVHISPIRTESYGASELAGSLPRYLQVVFETYMGYTTVFDSRQEIEMLFFSTENILALVPIKPPSQWARKTL